MIPPALLGTAAPAAAALTDVPAGYWAGAAIRSVAETRDWMRDSGAAFRPEDPLLRRHLARALVRAFAAQDQPGGVTFTDLPPADPSFPFAAVAVERGWMEAPGGAFSPDAGVATSDLDRALVLALGLSREVQGLEGIRTDDGRGFARPPAFGPLVLAHQLGLHRNHPAEEEWRELRPGSPVRRADAAYALHRAAAAAGTYRVAALARYRDVVLPAMSEERRRAMEFALSHAGDPYVYAGEWPEPTPPGYCCGPQTAGGFDCSGFAWWVLRTPGGGWDGSAFRPYTGWPLSERSSRHMARAARPRVGFARALPGDLLFFNADGLGRGWRGVDHVGLALGGGWMIHSSSGRDGVSIDWVGDGWWRGRFTWARRVIP